MATPPPPPPPTGAPTGPIPVVGQRIVIKPQPPITEFRFGTVKYVGETKFAPGIWVGVELAKDSGLGKNSGAVAGVEYFKTDLPSKGIFIRPELVQFELEKPEGERLDTILRFEIDGLKAQLGEKDAVIENLQTEKEIMQVDKEIVDEELLSVQQELATLKKQLDAVTRTDSAALDVVRLTELVDELRKENKSLEEKVEEAREQLNAAQGGDEQLDALTERKLELEDEVEALAQRNEKVEEERKELVSFVDDLEEELKEHRALLLQRDGDAEIAQQNMMKLENTVEEHVQLQQLFRSRITELEEKVVGLETIVAESELMEEQRKTMAEASKQAVTFTGRSRNAAATLDADMQSIEISRLREHVDSVASLLPRSMFATDVEAFSTHSSYEILCDHAKAVVNAIQSRCAIIANEQEEHATPTGYSMQGSVRVDCAWDAANGAMTANWRIVHLQAMVFVLQRWHIAAMVRGDSEAFLSLASNGHLLEGLRGEVAEVARNVRDDTLTAAAWTKQWKSIENALKSSSLQIDLQEDTITVAAFIPLLNLLAAAVDIARIATGQILRYVELHKGDAQDGIRTAVTQLKDSIDPFRQVVSMMLTDCVAMAAAPAVGGWVAAVLEVCHFTCAAASALTKRAEMFSQQSSDVYNNFATTLYSPQIIAAMDSVSAACAKQASPLDGVIASDEAHDNVQQMENGIFGELANRLQRTWNTMQRTQSDPATPVTSLRARIDAVKHMLGELSQAQADKLKVEEDLKKLLQKHKEVETELRHKVVEASMNSTAHPDFIQEMDERRKVHEAELSKVLRQQEMDQRKIQDLQRDLDMLRSHKADMQSDISSGSVSEVRRLREAAEFHRQQLFLTATGMFARSAAITQAGKHATLIESSKSADFIRHRQLAQCKVLSFASPQDSAASRKHLASQSAELRQLAARVCPLAEKSKQAVNESVESAVAGGAMSPSPVASPTS